MQARENERESEERRLRIEESEVWAEKERRSVQLQTDAFVSAEKYVAPEL